MVVFIRGVLPDFTIFEEFLTLRSMHDSTKGIDIYNEFDKFNQQLNLNNLKLFSVATDGCPSMIGKNIGFRGIFNQKRAEENLPEIMWHHCIIHIENLVAKSLKMPHITDVVISTVNYIRANAINHRKFKEFLQSVESKNGDLVMYTHVRWLSRSECIKRFYLLLPEVKNFLNGKKHIPQLTDEYWVADLAFLVDITSHLSTLNLSLQSKNIFCHELYSAVDAFIKKLHLWKSQLQNGNTDHFITISNHKKYCFFEKYTAVIENLLRQFKYRLDKLPNFQYNMQLFATPLSLNAADAPCEFQMELLDLQSDLQLKENFKSENLVEFWAKLPNKKYPNLILNALKYASVFGSTYSCEALFSKMVRIKTKYRSRLTDDHFFSQF